MFMFFLVSGLKYGTNVILNHILAEFCEKYRPIQGLSVKTILKLYISSIIRTYLLVPPIYGCAVCVDCINSD